MEYIILFVIFGILVILKGFSKGKSEVEEFENSNKTLIEHKKRNHLTTDNERKFYYALKAVLKDEYDIHCQVSLIALVEPVEFKHKKRAYSRRMDYVVTDKKTKVMCVIELDDASHRSKKRINSDMYINKALEGHHKLLRFNTKKFYEQSGILERLANEAGIQFEKDAMLNVV